jgi:predicted acyltransferase
MSITKKPERLKSLDALRGFDMLWIIGGQKVISHLAKASDIGFLNTIENQMHHVKWEGFHFYDLIMPLFLFMVGISIPFSLTKRLSMGDSQKKIYLHTLKRSLILFVLGMICQCHLLSFDIDQMHFIHDTLQAIAIGYMFSVLIFTRLNLKFQIALTGGLLLLYWIILTFIPVPGQQPGVLLPQSNIAKYVEQMVFGRFDDGPSSYTWLLGSLGFVATVMSGVLASTIIRGKIRLPGLKSSNEQIHKTVMLSGVGVTLVVLSLVFSIWFPVIKPIWNPTFVLLTSGISFLFIALFYFVIDVRGYHRWSFWLRVIGMNSIAVYMAVHMVNFEDVARHLVFGLEQFTNAYYPFIKSLTRLVIIYIIMYWMYKKDTFIKV